MPIRNMYFTTKHLYDYLKPNAYDEWAWGDNWSSQDCFPWSEGNLALLGNSRKRRVQSSRIAFFRYFQLIFQNISDILSKFEENFVTKNLENCNTSKRKSYDFYSPLNIVSGNVIDSNFPNWVFTLKTRFEVSWTKCS